MLRRHAGPLIQNSTFKHLDFDEVLATFDYCDCIHDNRSKLEAAAALASRLIARRAHSFRMQPSFSYFRKMNIALCRLKELNIYEEIRDMQKSIAVAKTARSLDDKYYLPTQENFFFFLAKFQSFTKLIIRIVACARESHRLFLELLYRAAFVEAISIFISTLAEIWTICIEMCKSAVQFYNQFRRHFVKNYEKLKELPKHLERWLADDYREFIDIDLNQSRTRSKEDIFLFDGSDNIDTHGIVIEQKFEPKLLVSQQIDNKRKAGVQDPKSKNKQFKTVDLLVKREFKIEEKPESSPKSAKPVITMKAMPINVRMESVDLGTKISRDEPSAPVRRVSNVKQINVDQIKMVKEIREFLAIEDELRSMKEHKNTLGVNDNEWERFKSSANQLLILGHPGLVLKKFKTLWQKLNRSRKVN